MLDRTELIPVADGERRRIGPIDCQFIPVTHSVPHGFAVAFFTPAGTIIHTGDFKLDLTPVDGRRTNLALLGEHRAPRRRRPPAAVRLDERRAARASRRRSRRSAPRCARCSASTPTSGSSSRASRRTCTAWSRSRRPRSRTAARSRSSAGRCSRTSRWRASAASSTSPTTRSSTSRRRPSYAPGEVCIICTGSQGEPMSALSLMAAHEHKHVKISPDDVVVISAHAIPGNESNVSRVIDSLHRAGAEVVHDRTSPVHVSGHASQEELKFLLNLLVARVVRARARRVPPPRAPRAARATRSACAADSVLVCEDGDVDHARRADGADGRAPRGARRATCTSTASSATSATACCATGACSREEGVVVVIVTVDTADRRDRDRPRDRDPRLGVRPRGRGPLEDAKQVGARRRSTAAIAEGATDFDTMRRHARRSLGQFIDERTRRRPIVIPVVMEV